MFAAAWAFSLGVPGMRRRAHGIRAGWLGVLIASLAASTVAIADEPRLNQLQVIGSHNSYHIAPDSGHPRAARLAQSPSARRGSTTPIAPWPSNSRSWGSRQIELDVYADPKGGLFAAARGPGDRARTRQGSGEDPDAGGALRQPGLKILHVPDIDFRTTAATFVDALKQIRKWSQANQRHVPILILVELKGDALPGLPARPFRSVRTRSIRSTPRFCRSSRRARS